MAINFDALDFTLLYQKVIIIALVSKVISGKNLFSHQNQKLRPGSPQSILLSVVGQSSVCVGNIRIHEKMAIHFNALIFLLSYRNVVQIELVSEVINSKRIHFRI